MSGPIGLTVPPGSGVRRRYQPDPAVTEDLVDALCRLLLEMPEDAAGTPGEGAQFDLLSDSQRARNVS